MDITICNTEEPQQKYRHGTVSNRLLGEGGGGLNMFHCLRNGSNQRKQLLSTKQTKEKHLTIIFTYFLFVLQIITESKAGAITVVAVLTYNRQGDDRTIGKNHNRSTALERSVIDYWEGGWVA